MKRMTLGHITLVTCCILAGLQSVSANPTGGQVAAGSASINTVPGTVTINQGSNTVIINWQTFSIGSGELTQFVQPSATSAALNRVLGGQTSIINGTLSATGQVYLVNGNGIVIGPGGVVNATSFTASTRDITDSDFLAGNLHFTGSNANGVQNLGTINALGGDVYMIGKTVDNQGAINAPNGTVGLASGDDVMLNLNGQEHVFVSATTTATSAASQTAVHNSGTIAAASAELKAANGNMFALAINNEGTVRATSVAQKGGRIFLTTDSGLVQNTGTLAAKSGNNGGNIAISGGSVWNRQTIDASGAQGGQVTVDSENFQNDGLVTVAGTAGAGGSVSVTHSGNALGSVTGVIDASGTTQGGSIQFLGTGADSEAYLSLALDASSSGGKGGSIGIDGSTVYITGANLTANGATGGGRIFVGKGDPITSPNLTLAQTTYVSAGTTITANATSSGTGGAVGVSGSVLSKFDGSATATGPAGNGSVSIVGPGGVAVAQGGTVSSFEFVDPDAGASNMFGQPSGILNLSSNNTVISSPGDSFAGAGAGAVYLFSDVNGALLSTLRGSHAGDAVGTTVQSLAGGNFAVTTPNWNGNIGAVTFGSGTTGFALGSGLVSSANSLVGSTAGDQVGNGGLSALGNGDYVVLSTNWNGNEGAVTWVDPTVGATGEISSSNSLVGSTAGDQIGSGGITTLANSDYLVVSPNWSNTKGAVTWGDATTGIAGQVSALNSLVGSDIGDKVGSGGIVQLSNGANYLVLSPSWGTSAAQVSFGGSGGTISQSGTNPAPGAITNGSDSGGLVGVVSATNSLIGTNGSTIVDSHDNYYLVVNPNWNNGAGAVTWNNDTAGTKGLISAANSLVGSISNSFTGNNIGIEGSQPAPDGDQVGSFGVTILNNGNYVINSPTWNGATGAVTWGSATSGVSGAVTSSNSLVGASAGDLIGSGGIVQLSNNSNYLVVSPNFVGPTQGLAVPTTGAITNGSDATGVTGVVSLNNSLLGTAGANIIDSQAGYYLVANSQWKQGAGAVTWNSDSNGTTGFVSADNSLVGSSGYFFTEDSVIQGDQIGGSGINILSNGNYVVSSVNWNGGAGAVTFGSASSGVSGTVSGANSLIGTSPSDHIGSGGITGLSNGSYIVDSPTWNSSTGAVTWGSGTSGVQGTVSSENSLVGASAGDAIGSGGIVELSNAANYLVLSPSWNGTKGAITNGSEATGVTGVVSASNSLVGAQTGDAVGTAGSITDTLAGYYLASTVNWNHSAGAVTWSLDNAGTTGVVSAANSLVGASANDQVGNGGINVLYAGHDNYVVISTNFGGGGAVTWGSATSGVSGVVSASNSLVGSSHSGTGLNGDALGSGGLFFLPNGNYLIYSPDFNGSAGAVTFASGDAPITGYASAANSLIGGVANEHIGHGGVTLLDNGNYLVYSPGYGSGAGAVTFGSETTGVSGVVGSGNSLVGSSQSDHVGSGGIISLPNGNYLVLSPFYQTSTGAATWGSANTGVTGVVSGANSLTGGGVNSGEQFSGFSSDGSLYLVSFTTDTSAGGDGRVFAGSVSGPASSTGFSSSPTTSVGDNLFDDQAVLSFEVSGENLVYSDSQFYIPDPGNMTLEPVSVDAETGGAINDGKGTNVASGSSTSNLSGPQRLVTPANGIWNIFKGTVHSTPPPSFVNQELHLVLSPTVYAELDQILFGSH
jgi:filamentous hemagglutinin family protein